MRRDEAKREAKDDEKEKVMAMCAHGLYSTIMNNLCYLVCKLWIAGWGQLAVGFILSRRPNFDRSFLFWSPMPARLHGRWTGPSAPQVGDGS